MTAAAQRVFLVEQEHRPRLEDFIPVAKAMGIVDVHPFWEAFDLLQRDWANYRADKLGSH